MDDKKVIPGILDLRNLDWTKTRRSSGTAGSFLKASETSHGVRWYYKLSDYDPYRGIVGHECINKIIADRLLSMLQIPHLSYENIRDQGRFHSVPAGGCAHSGGTNAMKQFLRNCSEIICTFCSS